jgi:hypothetical protein
MNNVEQMTWAALSGAVLTVFWPWLVAQKMATLTLPGGAEKPERN